MTNKRRNAGSSKAPAGAGAVADKPGKRLEKIVELIETQANKKAGVTVKSPAFLTDKLSGEPREFDVLLTIDAGHHRSMMVGIECRDRSRPVGVPDVEAFYTKCRDTGIDQGVIVSSKGFAATARKKAMARRIRCLELQQATQLDWCLAPGVFGYDKRPVHVHLYADFDGAALGKYDLYEGGTVKIGEAEAGRIALQVLNALQLDGTTLSKFPRDQVFVDRGTDHNPNFVAVDEAGNRHKVKTLTVETYFKVDVTFVPFQFHEYRDPETGELLSTAATADMVVGGRPLTLAIAGKPDGEKQLMMSPKSIKPAKTKMRGKTTNKKPPRGSRAR